MKLVSFQSSDGPKLGALIDDKILDLQATCQAAVPDVAFNRLLGGMLQFLEKGEQAFDAATHVIRVAEANPEKAVWSTDPLLPPVPNPRKLLLLAGNYASHIEEGGGTALSKLETTPRVFMKPPSTTMVAHEQPIVIPSNGVFTDWEAEIGIVIGKRGKFISADEANDYIAGYTIVNDVSERELKVKDSRLERDGDEWFDWLNGKWFDSFAPVGPCLATKDDIPDPNNLRLTLRVNGEVKQDANTGQMIFNPVEVVEFSSTLVTLEPGDIISTGTPAGVGHPDEQLADGDVVEIEIENIGVLRNPVVQE
jgi:2-keto-4-pentenoate hydratase/2-oxohepta-3-ene-1,7-dioic acid hydratase in catechol pathway